MVAPPILSTFVIRHSEFRHSSSFFSVAVAAGRPALYNARRTPSTALFAAMNEPQRILHIIDRLDGYGGARMLRELAARQAAEGGCVAAATLTASRPTVDELRGVGVAVHVLDRRWAIDPAALMRLRRMRRATPVDVVHAWDATSLAHAMATRPLGRRERLAATWNAAQFGSAWASRIVRAAQRRVAAFAADDYVTRDWLVRSGVDAALIDVIPAGVPPGAGSRRDRAAVAADLGLSPHDRWIAAAGPLTRRKQIDEAIWCYELVRVLHPELRLVIFGDGPDRPRLERFADLVSDPGCVCFAGFRYDLAQLLPHAAAYWQLDAPRSTPLAMLEAMAAEVPVVATDVPAHRAAVINEQTGYLVGVGSRADAARATDQILRDATLARRIGAAAADSIAQNWTLESRRRSYERLYRLAATD
jgi:glycosyltransferase involved in cell wall biosynthesis